MKIRVFVTILMTLFLRCDFVYAQFNEEVKSLHAVQTWVGKNGKGFKGVFMKREGDTLVIMKDGEATVYRVDINNLHPRTKKWFLGEWEKMEASRKEKASRELNKDGKGEVKPKRVKLRPGVVIDLARNPFIDSSGFKLVEEGKAPRDQVPNFNQADYGKKASDCLPNSYAMFLAWWHVRDWVKIDEKGWDYQEKVDWIHKRLARHMKTRNNSGTGVSEGVEGLTKFFSEEVKSKAAFTMQVVEDYRPTNLSKFTKGANCTVLCLSTYYGRRYQSGHAVALKRLDEDGTVEFNTWGLSLKGKLKAIPGSEKEIRTFVYDEEGRRKAEKIKLPQYEIELMNRIDLPEWFVNEEVRFVIEADKRGLLVVLTPYLPIEAPANEAEKE